MSHVEGTLFLSCDTSQLSRRSSKMLVAILRVNLPVNSDAKDGSDAMRCLELGRVSTRCYLPRYGQPGYVTCCAARLHQGSRIERVVMFGNGRDKCRQTRWQQLSETSLCSGSSDGRRLVRLSARTRRDDGPGCLVHVKAAHEAHLAQRRAGGQSGTRPHPPNSVRARKQVKVVGGTRMRWSAAARVSTVCAECRVQRAGGHDMALAASGGPHTRRSHFSITLVHHSNSGDKASRMCCCCPAERAAASGARKSINGAHSLLQHYIIYPAVQTVKQADPSTNSRRPASGASR